jgi:hypothetical protein
MLQPSIQEIAVDEPRPLPPFAFGLGQVVRRHADGSKDRGLVVGVIFGPPARFLVRWRSGGPCSLEPVDALDWLIEAPSVPL